MAKANLLKTETRNFLELIGNGKIYRVPPYQRDYSWGEEHWEDLWSDVVAMRGHSDDRHYMGALVVEGKSDREFLIIDGQQRIATLSVLALAILARLQQLANEGVDPEDNRERVRQLRGRFIGEKDPTSLSESSKLFLNVTDNAFYQDYLVQLREPLNPRALPSSNRALWECFRYFGRRIEKEPGLPSSGSELSALLNEAVARQLLFILITVEDDLNAYTVFETLNARGLELSATDLLKNYLFSRIKGQQDLELLGRRWHKLVTTVRQDKFPEFLRYHLLCEEPKIRQQRLFKLVRDRVTTPAEVFDLVTRLEARAELFSAIGDADHEYWKEYPDALPHVRELLLFRVRQPMPALFAAWEEWNRTDFVKLLKLIAVFSFRYTITSGLNPNDLEPLYHELAKGILNQSVRTPAQALSVLRRLYPTDDKFERDFAELTLPTGGQRLRLVRYVLCKIESATAQRHCDWLSDPATIEHVLPENPDESWAKVISPERQSQFVYRLGNLTLLEKRLNRDAGNRDFAAKRALYAQSAYRMPKQLDEHAPPEWSSAAIEARQRRMAERAKAIWRPDFEES
ncbi:MAG: DUF262 domain-containing HNH endonuclease family protein [Xanthomonadaceae bacterium]|nr:DUF262 domain-containing HNH endonuclease family protein [Xanthomonadaceae bacterium]